MSLQTLIQDTIKTWLIPRVYSLIIDNKLIINTKPQLNNNNVDILTRNSISGDIEIINSAPISNIPISDIESSGSSGVLVDTGLNIETNNDITINSLSAIDLTGANLNLLINPPIDNTIDSVLVRDNDGGIDRREISSFPFTSDTNIYSNNGSLTGNRTINLNSNDLIFNNSGELTLSNQPTLSTGQDILTRNSSTGNIEIQRNNRNGCFLFFNSIQFEDTSPLDLTFADVASAVRTWNDGDMNPGTGTFTVPENGIYQINLNFYFNMSGTFTGSNTVAVRISINGIVNYQSNNVKYTPEYDSGNIIISVAPELETDDEIKFVLLRSDPTLASQLNTNSRITIYKLPF